MPAYARALAKEVRSAGSEVRWGAREKGSEVHTVYFGGGTPSLLPLHLLAQVFEALRVSFAIRPDCEVTLEANPGTVDGEYLEGLRGLGVNRLSFGVQSAQPAELQLLDRLHTFEQVVEMVALARAVGFENLNLDLIFGLPDQTMGMWRDSLEKTLALQPQHLSLYALSLEHGTPLRAWVYRGLLPMPDPDLAAEMYEWACERLEAEGYGHYEISNWAKGGENPNDQNPNPQWACRHNLQYWRNLPYLGMGAGAHGYVGGKRYWNVLSPKAYIERLERSFESVASPLVGDGAQGPRIRSWRVSPAVAESSPVGREAEIGDTMIMGLRLLREGVEEHRFRERFGEGLAEKYDAELTELNELQLVEWDEAGVRLSRRGWLLGNRVFQKFV